MSSPTTDTGFYHEKDRVSPSNTASPPPRQAYRGTTTSHNRRPVRPRTRTGCLTCRARKVKCDESQPHCQNCKRCVLQCKWPVVEDFMSARIRRRKYRASVDRNFAADSGTGSETSAVSTREQTEAAPHAVPRQANGASARRGLRKHQDPGPDRPTEPSQQPMPQVTDGGPAPKLPAAANRLTADADFNIDLVPKSVLLQHIHAFFDCIYHCQNNGFVHRGTLLRLFQADRINRKLLLAICAVSSRFVSRSDAAKSSSDSMQARAEEEARAEAWAKEAKALLILDDMTIDTVTAALLLARHEINNGNFGSAWMLSSIATRAALAVGLNKEPPAGENGLAFTEQETRRRLFWACYCLDRMMSSGLTDLVTLRPGQISLQLPCEEHQYLYGIPCRTPMPHLEVDGPVATDAPSIEGQEADRNVGLFGHFVQIMEMRYCILRYVRNSHEDTGQPPPWDTSSTFVQCQRKMALWKRSLLPQFQLLPDTIYVRQGQDQLSSLVMLHVWYDQCMSDLYRITMPGFPETLPATVLLQAPAGWVQQQQLACVRHATGILTTLDTVASLIDMESFVFLDASLPMCVFESIRVQVQWLFMLPPDTFDQRMVECRAKCETLTSYITGMTKYFWQAQWLLNDMRRMLLRHNIPVQPSSGPNDEPFGDDDGIHPWQRRIRQLKHHKSNQASPVPMAATTGNSTTPISLQETHQNSERVNIGLPTSPATTGSLYAQSEAIDLDFSDQGSTLYQDGPGDQQNSWDEMQTLPGFANFIGTADEWLANGL